MTIARLQGYARSRCRSKLRIVDGDATGVPALDALAGLTGIDVAKAEIATLIRRLRIEAARRESGARTTPISLHMVFAGPPGTSPWERCGSVFGTASLRAEDRTPEDLMKPGSSDAVAGGPGP